MLAKELLRTPLKISWYTIRSIAKVMSTEPGGPGGSQILLEVIKGLYRFSREEAQQLITQFRGTNFMMLLLESHPGLWSRMPFDTIRLLTEQASI